MPELVWTDADHDAPTLPPPSPSPRNASVVTRVEVPRPKAPPARSASRQSAALLGQPPCHHGASTTKLEIPRPASKAPTSPGAPLPPPASFSARPSESEFDARASAALPLMKPALMKPTARPGCWSANSSTTMWIRETRALPLLRPLAMDKIRILMTQALPLVRVNHSDRLLRRAFAERVAWVVFAAAALTMVMLAIASTLG